MTFDLLTFAGMIADMAIFVFIMAAAVYSSRVEGINELQLNSEKRDQ